MPHWTITACRVELCPQQDVLMVGVGLISLDTAVAAVLAEIFSTIRQMETAFSALSAQLWQRPWLILNVCPGLPCVVCVRLMTSSLPATR